MQVIRQRRQNECELSGANVVFDIHMHFRMQSEKGSFSKLSGANYSDWIFY